MPLFHTYTRRLLFVVLLVVFSNNAFAQAAFELVSFFDIETPAMAYLGNQKKLYLIDQNANLRSYDSQGEVLEIFSPQRRIIPSLLNVQNNIRPFLFYQEAQEYAFLNRFLTEIETYNIGGQGQIGNVQMAVPAQDNGLWLIDESDFSLKKYFPQNQTLTVNTPLAPVLAEMSLEVVQMEEYQNRLFVGLKSGRTLIFDNLGNYLRSIQAQSFSFFQQEILFIDAQRNALVWQNIYVGNQREIVFPATRKIEFAFQQDKTLFLVGTSQVWVYEFEN
jgi:hypothetical protein